MMLGKLLKALLKPILNRKVLIVLLVALVLAVSFFIFKNKVVGAFQKNETVAVPETKMFVCWDGSKVDRSDYCPPEAVKNTSNAKNVTAVVPKPPAPEKPVLFENPIYPEVTTWTQDEIVAAMGVVNPSYKLPVKRRVVYDSTHKGSYSYQGSSNRLIEDPFWLLRNQFFHNSYELTVNNMRTNVYESPQFYLDLVKTSQEDAGLKILNPEVFAQWKEFSCGRMESCRNIVAVNCTRGDHTLYAWNYYPEQPNTIEKRYTMTAMDDKGASLNTFEEFYCKPA
jgi:hypothetical protein